MIDLAWPCHARQPLLRQPCDLRLDAAQAFLTLARRRDALLNHERRSTSSGAHT
ncbi:MULTISPECIES: hypothetical protein [Vogesella]|uniref:Uncharacterized protein n=2 Tax=Vogesella TaxID=57739 RepID=A0ABT5I5B8_VOGIN|nr:MULTISPECIES: hypothetical protein [Vogesella]MCQ4144369.1 hypothetical protein [Vogesella sp. AC12]MDC7691365.1 hypothetical protein [Vogesella indigofera]MDC7698447.1 hypothetical protein [Vogesella indigofera]MDC7701991.1 hypothetical protein [Vogesella indigofera]MDC7704925.1 hypothetical protein [Vogesella indigofera]